MPLARCRSCGHENLVPVLSLGNTPLANSLVTPEQLNEVEPTYPLDLVFCSDCTLLQITETVPPKILFGEYLYFSSFSDTMLRHAKRIVDRLVDERSLDSVSLVVEIASNDGYLLQYYKRHEVPVLGVEPAANIARAAEERGIRTLNQFFDQAVAAQIRTAHGGADVIHANNVIAHVAELRSVVGGIKTLLTRAGVAVIEVPHVEPMLANCEFDTIYHEHLFYFSLHALEDLFASRGLVVSDVEELAIHGGSLRLFVTHEGTAEPTAAVAALRSKEAAWGVADPASYQGFGTRVEQLKESLRTMLGELKAAGKTIAAYGAAAKGSTLLNYCGIGSETLDFVVDRSTHKQGLFMPGVRIPIYPPERLAELAPDYAVVLAWNFAEEIMEQQDAYRAAGGRFIIPIPEPRIA